MFGPGELGSVLGFMLRRAMNSSFEQALIESGGRLYLESVTP